MMHFLLQCIREQLEMSLLQNSQQNVKRTGYVVTVWLVGLVDGHVLS